MTKMIPPVPTSAVMMPTPKQKIGFSIASIVGSDGGSNPAGNNDNANCNVSSNGAITITNIDNNRQNANEIANNNSSNNSNGPSSPPQTPPMFSVGATHLRPGHFYAVTQTHLPTHPQLTAAQQHALHQHFLLQHQHQQQQHQGQQQSHLPPQQQHQLSLKSSPQSPNSPSSRTSVPSQDIQDIIQRLQNSASAAVAAANLSATVAASSEVTYSNTPQNVVRRLHQHTRLLASPEAPDESTSSPNVMHLKRERSPLPPGIEQAQNPAQRHQPPQTPPTSVSPPCVPSHLPSPPSTTLHPNSPPLTPHHYQKPEPILLGPGGISPAGLVRPFPMGPSIPGGSGGPPPPPPPPQQHMPDIKALPPYINAPPELPPQHNPHLIAAAHFQMAATLQAGHVLGPAAAAAAAAGLPPHASFMPNPGMPRDSYPLYPWLLSRHGRIFPHRFPGNFLLQPFRKPKRIRTAFSPSQLLKLEHAFESNQYVVGAERKALAQSLNLSETQVKVWFQNRRTKHKRMQQEDEKGGSSGSGGGVSSERNSQGGVSCDDDDDDELIDMEMDDCPSDEEHDVEHVDH